VNSGIQDNDFIEIKSGIQKNDEIICGPYRVVSKTLNEATKIKIVKKEDLYKTDN
jgi:HlyD family secretion protein